MSINPEEHQNQFQEPEFARLDKISPLKLASLLFLLFGFYFLIFAMVQFIINTFSNNYHLDLNCIDRNCSTETPSLRFTDNHPVYIYLKTSVFEKDMNIFNSYSPTQAEGIYNSPQDQKLCYGAFTNRQMNKKVNVFGQPLDQDAQSFPCGKRMLEYPQGSLFLYSEQSQISIKLNASSLVNQYAHNSLFKNTNLSKQWIDTEQSQFKTWLNEPSSFDTAKYWGSIDEDISGPYRIDFILDINSLVGTYQVILTDSATIGGVNQQLCIISFSKAVCCFMFGIVSFVTNRKFSKVSNSD